MKIPVFLHVFQRNISTLFFMIRITEEKLKDNTGGFFILLTLLITRLSYHTYPMTYVVENNSKYEIVSENTSFQA